MQDNNSETTGNTIDDHAPKPWQQQPQEPPDHFGWFQVYLTLPLPRYIVRVAQIVGMNPSSSWISKIARKWRWLERAEALDAEMAQQLVVQSELRHRLLKDAAFTAQFQGLHDTNRAIDSAAIGDMDRDEARQCLSAIFQHQRGLLRSLALQMESDEVKSEEERHQQEQRQQERLEELVLQRAHEIRSEKTRELLEEVYGSGQCDAEDEPGNSPPADIQKERQI